MKSKELACIVWMLFWFTIFERRNMNNYHCQGKKQRFCVQDVDLLCPSCLLKEIPAQRMLEELISRKLVMVQKDSHTHKIQGYYI